MAFFRRLRRHPARSCPDGCITGVSPCAAVPRLVRLRDAPVYLGMDKNRFNRDVRPRVVAIPVGTQGIAFDRLDLDAWADDHKRRNGRPTAQFEGGRHGTAKTARSHPAGQGLAHRQRHLRNSHLRKPWHRRSQGGGSDSVATARGSPGQQVLRSSQDTDVPRSGDPISGGTPAQAKSRTGCPVTGGVGSVYRHTDAPTGAVRHPAGLHSRQAERGKESGHGQPRPGGRAAARYPDELGSPCPAGFRSFRVHDLEHTFGYRLRAAGVAFEDRQCLLGHEAAHITTHYSAVDIRTLTECSEKVCDLASRKSPALSIVRSAGRSQVAENTGGKGGSRTLDPGIMSSTLRSK